MKKITKITSLIIALCLSLAMLCSCGESTVYKVITEPTFPPFDTTDESGNIVGFDMDLISAIAEDQGFEVEFESMGFDALIPAIEAGNADIIAAGMNAMDEARQKKVDFSSYYYDSGLVVLVKDSNTAINSIDDLTKDMKVASQIQTTGASKANELVEKGQIKEAVILDQFDTCVLQVVNGDVDAVIIDLPVAQSYIKKQPGKIKIVGDTLNAESYGFAVQKGNSELLDKINAGLEEMKSNGTYDELYDKWFNN